MSKLIHEDLTYNIRGILFDVHNELGPNLPEKYYQEAVAIGLEEKGLEVQTEKEFEVLYKGVPVGRYYVDVWVEQGKVLLELKVATEIEPVHEAQAISYLKVTDADLAIVANFGQGRLQDKRLPNFLHGKSETFYWQKKEMPQDFLYPELMDKILQVLHRVHFELGSGFLHQVYRRATRLELLEQGVGFEYVKQVPVYYHSHHLGDQPARLFCVEGKLLLGTIAVREIDEGLVAQMKARLKLLDVMLGIIANFHGTQLEFVVVRSGDSG